MGLSIDTKLKYCLQCNEEYRAEIEVCAHCHATLLFGEEILKKAENILPGEFIGIVPGEPLVPIRKGPALQIKQLKLFLKESGFDSMVNSDPETCGKGCCGTELILEVRETDLESVVGLLASEHEQSTGLHELDNTYADAVFDTNHEEATCPACGFTFSTSSSTCPDCGLCFG